METSYRSPACSARLATRQSKGASTSGDSNASGPEQLAFLEVFIKNRGIIRNVESELGISYPTVRNRLDDLLRALGFEVRDDEPARETPTKRTNDETCSSVCAEAR